MNQDEEHLNLLSVFHYVVGAINILFGVFILLFYGGIGVAIALGAFPGGKGSKPDPTGWVFLIFGSILALLAWTLGTLTIVAGRKLRRHSSRVFCLVMAAIQCLNQPLGIILGIFTIMVLMRPSVIALFDVSRQVESDRPAQ